MNLKIIRTKSFATKNKANVMNWVLFLDADEVVTDKLKKEISVKQGKKC